MFRASPVHPGAVGGVAPGACGRASFHPSRHMWRLRTAMLPFAASAEDRMDHNDIGPRLHDYATGELTQAIACLAWRGPRVHAGVHQARKSLRRVRATLALGTPLLGPGARLIDRELRSINRGLSKLRDAHALAGALEHLLARHGGDAQAMPLLLRARRAAERNRASRARKELAADPALRDRRALLATLLAALHGLPWDLLDAGAAEAALLRSRANAHAASAAAADDGDADDWHRWRRRARCLSQQQRALGNRGAKASTDKRDKQLAILLGEAQDRALLIECSGRKSPFAPPDRARLRLLAEQDLARLRARIATLADNAKDPAGDA